MIIEDERSLRTVLFEELDEGDGFVLKDDDTEIYMKLGCEGIFFRDSDDNKEIEVNCIDDELNLRYINENRRVLEVNLTLKVTD